MAQREKEVWRNIIELYRDLPCLWQTNHDHYHNKYVRAHAMSSLHAKYKTFDPDISLPVFKKKIENMRSSYYREKKKVMNSSQMCDDPDDVHVPSLWYYELLSFLDEKDIAVEEIDISRTIMETEVSGYEEDETCELNSKVHASAIAKKRKAIDAMDKGTFVKKNLSLREKAVWREIFELYRESPCLWKTHHEHYHHRGIRAEAMSLLYEKYKTYDPDVYLPVFKRKLENMRASYQRERKKMKNSLQTGADSDNNVYVYVPTLWYYELLTFLDEKDTVEETEVSVYEGEESCELESKFILPTEDEMCEFENIPQLLSPTKKRKRTDNMDNPDQDLFDAYGAYVAAELRSVKDEIEVETAKYHINNILYKMKMGQLKYVPAVFIKDSES